MASKLESDELYLRLFLAYKSYEGRLGSKVSQAALAEAIGESQPTISEWLRKDGRVPSVEQVERVARVLGVSPGWVAFNEGVMLSGAHPPAKPLPAGRLTKVATKREGKRRP